MGVCRVGPFFLQACEIPPPPLDSGTGWTRGFWVKTNPKLAAPTPLHINPMLFVEYYAGHAENIRNCKQKKFNMAIKICREYKFKLDGVGPVDNRPSTD